MSIRNKIPETRLLVSTQCIRHIPQEVAMEIHIAEFPSIITCHHLCREALITGSHTDRRSEPFSKIGIDAWTDSYIKSLIQENVDTATDTNEPIVTESVCFIWASNDFAILIPVSILLSFQSRRCCHRDSHQSRSPDKIIKTFHNHYNLMCLKRPYTNLV